MAIRKHIEDFTNQKKKETSNRDFLIIIGLIVLIFTIPLFGFFFGLIGFFGGLIFGCVLLLAGLLQPKKEYNKEMIQVVKEMSKSKENAIDVLKLRYAKGEITKEEFEGMKKDIDD